MTEVAFWLVVASVVALLLGVAAWRDLRPLLGGQPASTAVAVPRGPGADGDVEAYMLGLATLDGELMWAGMSDVMRQRIADSGGRASIVRTANELRAAGWTGVPHFVGGHNIGSETWLWFVVHARGPDGQERHVVYRAIVRDGVLQEVEWVR